MRRGSLLLLLALGCDPTAGLTDSAEAAAPSIKRYFDGAGTRVAEGPWSRVVVDLDPDTFYHVGGRRLDDREPTFHIFGADARDGCSVGPNAGTWLMGKPLTAPYRVLPYLESSDEQGRGTLRFMTLDCEVEDVVVENATRPHPHLYDNGYLVPTNEGYTFVDPWQGTTREIAKQLVARVNSHKAILLFADGKLKSFSYEYEAGQELGDELSSVVILDLPFDRLTEPDEYLVEDAQGIHRVEFDGDALTFEQEQVLADGCHLQPGDLDEPTGGWIILELPCGSRASLVRLDEHQEPVEQVELPAAAVPEHTVALPNQFSFSPTEAETELTATMYLTDVEGDQGTLWGLRAGADEPVKLAERAKLLGRNINVWSDGDWDGKVRANYQVLGGVETFDSVLFRWNGETETIYERVVQNSTTGETLLNFDGVAADLPLWDINDYSILAERVPISGGEASSLIGERRYARIDHFDGQTGRLVLGARADDASGWQELGEGVPPGFLRFSWFMPALLFLENWDAEREVGSLVAYNYALDARATLAEGVSSFDLTNYPWEGVIYAVPYGSKKGLWFSKAK